MRHKKKVFKIGRRQDHVRALLANQVCSLLNERRIQTTLTKAKEVRRLAERMITLGKRGELHHRRRAISKLHQVDTVRLLFNEIAPMYATRNGGYTRIIRLGHRRGDAAPMCFLELVEQETKEKVQKPASQNEDAKEKEKPAPPVVDDEVPGILPKKSSEGQTEEKVEKTATASADLVDPIKPDADAEKDTTSESEEVTDSIPISKTEDGLSASEDSSSEKKETENEIPAPHVNESSLTQEPDVQTELGSPPDKQENSESPSKDTPEEEPKKKESENE